MIFLYEFSSIGVVFFYFNFYGSYPDTFSELVVILEDKGCLAVGRRRVSIYLELLHFCKGNYA